MSDDTPKHGLEDPRDTDDELTTNSGEPVPEVVRAKGGGACGTFTVTTDEMPGGAR